MNSLYTTNYKGGNNMYVDPFTLGTVLGVITGIVVTLIVIFVLALTVGGKKK